MSAADIRRRFNYEPPDAERVAKHERVRALCFQLAGALDRLLPDVPEKARALDAVDDACKHSNAALARGPMPDDGAGSREPSGPFTPQPAGATGVSASVQVYLNSPPPDPHVMFEIQRQQAMLRHGVIHQ